MKKLIVGLVLVLVIVGMEFSPMLKADASGANSSIIEQPLRVDLDRSQTVPFGYERVTVHVQTPEKAKALWMRATGSMEGYSLEKANQITFVSRVGAPPCACYLEGAPYVYYGRVKDAPPDCRDECH